jgi:hypothetical protein
VATILVRRIAATVAVAAAGDGRFSDVNRAARAAGDGAP